MATVLFPFLPSPVPLLPRFPRLVLEVAGRAKPPPCTKTVVGAKDRIATDLTTGRPSSAEAMRYGFKRAGLGMPLDGTEDDLVWAPDVAIPAQVTGRLWAPWEKRPKS